MIAIAGRAQDERATAGCVACGSQLGSPERIGAVMLAACPACGSRTALPRPLVEETAALHASEAYFNKSYFHVRRNRPDLTRARAERVLSLVRRARPGLRLAGRRLLDVGCDTGGFAAATAALAGVSPYGVDVAPHPLDAARAAGVVVWLGDLATAPDDFREFALVTAIDVIEHVPDPLGLLREARSRLADDGLVYLQTPNWQSLVYGLGRIGDHALGGRPHDVLERLFPAEHVQYLTPRGLRQLARRAGLRPLALFTQTLDGRAIAGATSLRALMGLLQLPDRLLGRHILLTALLEPSEEPR